MPALDTPSGLKIDEPIEVLRGFVRRWYPMYDGVNVIQDNTLRIEEIALSTMVNSRISGNTAGDIWRHRSSIEEALALIPTEVDILDFASFDDVPGREGIRSAISSMCKIRRCKLGVATKILHKKRPGLIPIFDSMVRRHYWLLCKKRFAPKLRRDWGDFGIALVNLLHEDLIACTDVLRSVRQTLEGDGTPMTGGRILDCLVWAVEADEVELLRNYQPEVSSLG